MSQIMSKVSRDRYERGFFLDANGTHFHGPLNVLYPTEDGDPVVEDISAEALEAFERALAKFDNKDKLAQFRPVKIARYKRALILDSDRIYPFSEFNAFVSAEADERGEAVPMTHMLGANLFEGSVEHEERELTAEEERQAVGLSFGVMLAMQRMHENGTLTQLMGDDDKATLEA